MTAQLTGPTTHTLEVPGALLTYDTRSGGAGDAPVLLLRAPRWEPPGSARSLRTSPTARW